MFEYWAHKKACAFKQNQRKTLIEELPARFHEPIGASDTALLKQPISAIISAVQAGQTDPSDVLTAYGKMALKAHAETNCLTEVMIGAAQELAKTCNKQGPLAGVPVSLKDSINVEGWDSSIGFSCEVGKPAKRDSALVRLLRDAGAIPFVKTNVPITLMSAESYNDVFGRTINPHKSTHSPGGSTGGEGALLAYGGSRVGFGGDVAGSVRLPAHYSGVYSIRGSHRRFPCSDNPINAPFQEGVPVIGSPMTRTLEDLETVWKGVFAMKPWNYDFDVLKMPWKDVDLSSQKLRFAVIWDDGVVEPSLACHRALNTVVEALLKNGHEMVAADLPSPYEGLKISTQLLFADAAKGLVNPIRRGETTDSGVIEAIGMGHLPGWIRRLYTMYIRYIRRDETYAGLLDGWCEKTIPEYFDLLGWRQGYKSRWFHAWQREKLDFVLTVPNPLPAVPHNGMKEAFSTVNYTVLFNLLDYTAGVLPVTHVDAKLDKLHHLKPRNRLEQCAYKLYDSTAMEGLPVGVQIVGQRLEEEKVLAGMKLVKELLKKEGVEYRLLNEL